MAGYRYFDEHEAWREEQIREQEAIKAAHKECRYGYQPCDRCAYRNACPHGGPYIRR